MYVVFAIIVIKNIDRIRDKGINPRLSMYSMKVKDDRFFNMNPSRPQQSTTKTPGSKFSIPFNGMNNSIGLL